MRPKYDMQRQYEYRIPKRVTEIKIIGDNFYAICPMCKRLLDREYMEFCDVCGQNLSWRRFAKVIKKTCGAESLEEWYD